MKLVCQRCDHRGGADLSFMWFAKKFETKAKQPDATPRERTLMLCPDCAADLGSDKKCAAFLRQQLKE